MATRFFTPYFSLPELPLFRFLAQKTTMHFTSGLHQQRELDKFNLQTFHADVYNSFDSSADEMIEKLMENGRQALEQFKDEYATDEPEATRNVLHDPYWRYNMDAFYREEQLITISQMKIVFAFRLVEINVQKLLKAAYKNNVSFYRWDDFKSFFKSKAIRMETIAQFREVDQLRTVNNAIKHNDALVGEAKNIQEFKNKDYYASADLLMFYNRVKQSPHVFLEALAAAVYNDLYGFDQEKIQREADALALRMERATAEEFINYFKDRYEAG